MAPIVLSAPVVFCRPPHDSNARSFAPQACRWKALREGICLVPGLGSYPPVRTG